jgi:alkylation response protein AidB-like acyl-CoA dehydrogenase
LVARTDPDVAKHRGLSYFILDMKLPGIEVRPIKQLSGASGVNEVFFTDVRVSDTQRLGAVGQGWQVSMTTLMNERAVIGLGGDVSIGFGAVDVAALMKLAQRITIDGEPAIRDASVRARLADWYVREAGLKFTGYRSLTALSRGEVPGPENSIGKLVGAPMAQDMAAFALDLMEESGSLWDAEALAEIAPFQSAFMSSPGMRIAGGTDEIMRNIIAERVLGLPQEPRVDKGIPFREIPTSSQP